MKWIQLPLLARGPAGLPCRCGAKPHQHTELGRLISRRPACDLDVRGARDAAETEWLEALG